jgi:hypothetical protein
MQDQTKQDVQRTVIEDVRRGGGAGQPASASATQTPLPGVASLTSDQAAALRAQRRDFEQQLQRQENLRQRLTQELRSTPDEGKPGLVQRLKTVDEQIMALDGQISTINRQLMGAPRPTASEMMPPPSRTDVEDIVGMVGGFSMVLLLPLMIAYARRIWRRSAAPTAPAGWQDSMRRFERMEQAVDAVAIEVERISETQRFLTRVLLEKDPQLAAQNTPDPLPIRRDG